MFKSVVKIRSLIDANPGINYGKPTGEYVARRQLGLFESILDFIKCGCHGPVFKRETDLFNNEMIVGPLIYCLSKCEYYGYTKFEIQKGFSYGFSL